MPHTQIRQAGLAPVGVGVDVQPVPVLDADASGGELLPTHVDPNHALRSDRPLGAAGQKVPHHKLVDALLSIVPRGLTGGELCGVNGGVSLSHGKGEEREREREREVRRLVG